MKKLINLSLLLFKIHLALIAISAQTEQKTAHFFGNKFSENAIMEK